MKIYKYYRGKVHELEVRETEKMFIADDHFNKAFGYSWRFRKEECALTPLEAVHAVINQRSSFKQRLREKIQEIDADLDILRKLKRTYK